MSTRNGDLAAMLGSRICHDLISPIGAIGNGLELISMGGMGDGPELSLITESLGNAQARIRYYRIAYGLSGTGQSIGRPEVVDIIEQVNAGSRLNVNWVAEGDVLREDAKLVFLLLQCFETAMPYGGAIAVDRAARSWTLTGTAPKLKDIGPLWDRLTRTDGALDDLAPAQIQFALAPDHAATLGRTIGVDVMPTRIVCTV